jgi:hypothetical protein
LWVTLLLTFLCFAITAAAILVRDRWLRVDAADPRKKLATEVFHVLRGRVRSVAAPGRGGA